MKESFAGIASQIAKIAFDSSRSNERIGLQRELPIVAEVVDPGLFGPGFFAVDATIKEQHVGLHALRIEDPRAQAEQRVYVAVVVAGGELAHRLRLRRVRCSRSRAFGQWHYWS